MLSPDITSEDIQIARDVLVAMHGYKYSGHKILLLGSKKVDLGNTRGRTYECEFDLDIYVKGDIISSSNGDINFGISKQLISYYGGDGSGLYLIELLDNVDEWMLHKSLRPGTYFRRVLNYSFDAEGI